MKATAVRVRRDVRGSFLSRTDALGAIGQNRKLRCGHTDSWDLTRRKDARCGNGPQRIDKAPKLDLSGHSMRTAPAHQTAP
jgi:hypothetical protein